MKRYQLKQQESFQLLFLFRCYLKIPALKLLHPHKKRCITERVIRPMKPVKVNAIPPILKNIFGFIKEKTIPCINLPIVNAVPEK